MNVISHEDALSKGLTRYFTGKPCKQGHICERYISSKGCIECQKEYQNTRFVSPEYKKIKRERWWKNNPGKRSQSRNKWQTKDRLFNNVKYILTRANQRAKEKGLEFSIGPEDVVTPEVCPILGIKLEIGNQGGPTDSSPSLDRIDSKLGYVKGNVWVISNRANRLKNDGTAEEHDLIAKAIRGKNEI